ncbi:MAG TPA: GNAT family N-acetyltransferase [Candidatus Limnocylindria bacterium]|nr:GNAT family N-acetyltransferase [Candidatus Limnocylindria bacterium]
MQDIQRVTADEARDVLSQLVALLQDAVHDGASIGFTQPLSADVAERYWQDVFREMGQVSRILLTTRRDGVIVGSVQLGLCTRPNGLHRAEVQKLFVHTRWRRQGIARSLMAAIEQEAHATRRSLLYLDTEPHKPAAAMYEQMGWTQVGEIPGYACSPDGRLHGTVIFYRTI